MTEGFRSGGKNKDEWLHYLESTHPADIEMGLGRVTQVAQSLDLFKPAPITIVIGGTNGKGTTTALLGQLLAEKGLSSACYNSPHIHQYNERINCRNSKGKARLSSDKELCLAFSAIEQGRGGIPLTYFEFGTLAALWQIKQWQVDVALLEVGLGGRLDAVNIVDTDLAIVTSVGLDHQDWLGDTLDLIGYEKAGIGRKDKPLICGQPNVSKGFLDHAQKIGANLIRIDEHYTIKPKPLGWTLNLALESSGIDQSPSNKPSSYKMELPKGHIPFYNIASAIAGLASIDLLPNIDGIKRAIDNTRVAGRLTHYSCSHQGKEINFILDVAHNPQAAGFLASQLSGCTQAILALLIDKDPIGIITSLDAINDWHLAGLAGYRGQTVNQLNDSLRPLFSHKITSLNNDVAGAIDHCLESANNGETILVIGSFYTVAAAEYALENHSQLKVIHNGR
jgi:dihydrofolate synthase/folylpolyglutamate synthase